MYDYFVRCKYSLLLKRNLFNRNIKPKFIYLSKSGHRGPTPPIFCFSNGIAETNDIIIIIDDIENNRE